MKKAIKVFDKNRDRNGLLGLAQECNIASYSAFEEVLKDDCLSVFVHVTGDDWNTLCAKLPANRNALRFSTAKLLYPKPPEGPNRNCFCCLKPTKDSPKVTEEEFKRLVEGFEDEDKLRTLRSAVPPQLRGLISFSTPHRLRALHILLQACMVEWSYNSLHRLEALKLLGCNPVPSSLGAKVNRLGLFYRILTDQPWPDSILSDDKKNELLEQAKTQLREELGVEDRSDAILVAVESLVDEVFSLSQEDAELSWSTGKPVFEKLDELPRV